LPIRSPLDERTRQGDDHPLRLFLRFLTDHGEKRAMEVIWGNRLKPGDHKYIGGFPHADAGDDRVGPLARRDDRPRSRLRHDLEGCGAGAPGRHRRVATATTRTPPASAISRMCGWNGGEATRPTHRQMRPANLRDASRS